MGNIRKKLLELKSIVLDAQPLGVETEDFIAKIESTLQQFNDDVLRIVLMGTFSDGKTSVIAGLLGQVKSNMTIDQDESTDEISIYRFEGVDNVEIIDTPGLFGTKEKDVDGEVIKLSDITKKYISEANVLVYVCSAGNPLKDSHADRIRLVLRDLGKLDSTIFVLNKMDSVGTKMLDDESYRKFSDTKKGALIKRLRAIIDLTVEEEKNLKIVCVAADPKEKGLDYWLSPERKESYLQRSRIGSLKSEIDDVVENSDVRVLKEQTGLSVIRDVIMNTKKEVDTLTSPIKKSLKDARSFQEDLSSNLKDLRADVIASMNRLTGDLHSYETLLISGINGCTGETILQYLETELGLQGETIDYHVVFRNVNQLISTNCEANLSKLEAVKNTFEQKYNLGKTVVEDAFKEGMKHLDGLKIDSGQVLKFRDVLANHFNWASKIKFKPWGAVNLAKNITNWLGYISGGLTFFFEARNFIKERKDAKQLHEMKLALKSDVTSIFNQIYNMMNDEEAFFGNFAPNYLEMRDLLVKRNVEIEKLIGQIALLQQYNDRLSKWIESVKVDDQTNNS